MQASFEELMSKFVEADRIESIDIRPEIRVEVVSVTSAMLDLAYGIQVDHYAGCSEKIGQRAIIPN